MLLKISLVRNWKSNISFECCIHYRYIESADQKRVIKESSFCGQPYKTVKLTVSHELTSVGEPNNGLARSDIEPLITTIHNRCSANTFASVSLFSMADIIIRKMKLRIFLEPHQKHHVIKCGNHKNLYFDSYLYHDVKLMMS